MSDNELIAVFMGFFKFEETPITKTPIYKLLDWSGNPIHPYYGPMRPEQMQFNNSWDWLMPVVERIESLNYQHAISIGAIRVFCHTTESADCVDFEYGTSIGNGKSKIQAVYSAVVHFINWYNEQSK